MPETRKPDELAQFASDLQSMRHRAIDLGLRGTGQQLESAIQSLDTEIARETDGRRKNEVAQAPPQRPSVLYASGPGFHCPRATPCPDCGSTVSEMRTYGGSWDDADIHCAHCGKLIHCAWFPLRAS